MVGQHWHECHGLLAMLQWTCRLYSPHAAATLVLLSHILLLSRYQRDWAIVPSGSCHADCRLSQRRLCNHVSPCQPPVKDLQPYANWCLQYGCVTYGMHAPWMTITNWIVNTRKTNTNSNLQTEHWIFEHRLTSLVHGLQLSAFTDSWCGKAPSVKICKMWTLTHLEAI